MFRKLLNVSTPGFLFLTFLLLAAGIAGAGIWVYKQMEKSHLEMQESELSAIAHMKANQIANWRKDRLRDARVIAGGPLLVERVRELERNRQSAAALADLRAWLRSVRSYENYRAVYLIDMNGQPLLPSTEDETFVTREEIKTALRVIATGEPVFLDVHRHPKSGDLHLGVLAPIVHEAEDGRPVGVVLLQIHPDEFLYPLIQWWPTQSRSSELLLLRREGDRAVFLNELRHRKNTALMLRLPIDQEGRIASQAVRGQGGTMRGVDYRDVPVLAAVEPVPDSQWRLVAKTDLAEVLGPLQRQAWFVGIAVGALILMAGTIVGLLWHRQTVDFYRQQYEAERQRQALIRHFDYLTEYANDIIILFDEHWNIIEVNERACKAYGFTRQKLLSMNVRDLRAPQARAHLDSTLQRVTDEGGLIYETAHQRRDGTSFLAECSTRLIEVEGEKFFQTIIRDITERRKQEFEIRKLNAELEKRVAERTAALERANLELQEEIDERRRADEEIRRLNDELQERVVELETARWGHGL